MTRARNKAKDAEYNKRYKQLHRKEIAAKRKAKALARRKATNWRIMLDYVREELDDFASMGIKPTLRAMHYRLYSKHSQDPRRYAQYHNTKNFYNALSHNTAIAREGTNGNNFYGDLPIDCFADESREAIYPANTELNYEEPDDHAQKLIDKLKELPNTYAKDLIPKWVNQPHYVEVWTEKKAMVASIQSIIGDRQVAIVPLGGQPSVSYLWESCSVLKDFEELTYEYEDENGNTKTGVKTIHVIYLGDLDPSGEAIQESVQQKMEMYGVSDIDFQKLGVTKQQVDDLKLPEDPDPETLNKLENDNNRHKFRTKYGKLMQIEVDALVAYDAKGFRSMIEKAIDEKFNDDIYQKALKEYSSESIQEKINKSIRYEFNLRRWW